MKRHWSFTLLASLGVLAVSSLAFAERGGGVQFSGVECTSSRETIDNYFINEWGFINQGTTGMWATCPIAPPSHDTEEILRNITEVTVYYQGPRPSAYLTYHSRSMLGVYYSAPLVAGTDNTTGHPLLRLATPFRLQQAEAGMQIEFSLGPGTRIVGGNVLATVHDVVGGT